MGWKVEKFTRGARRYLEWKISIEKRAKEPIAPDIEKHAPGIERYLKGQAKEPIAPKIEKYAPSIEKHLRRQAREPAVPNVKRFLRRQARRKKTGKEIIR